MKNINISDIHKSATLEVVCGMKSVLKKSDMRFVNRIKKGWTAHRDYDIVYITNGKEIINISKPCFNRLTVENII
jgi:hypothetical protein